MSLWNVIQITRSTKNKPVFHVKHNNGSHAEFMVDKVGNGKLFLKCIKSKCKSRLTLLLREGGLLSTEKVDGVWKFQENTENREFEISNYETEILHKHTRRTRCQTLNSEGECLITRHSIETCTTVCGQQTKRKFADECKQLLEVIIIGYTASPAKRTPEVQGQIYLIELPSRLYT